MSSGLSGSCHSAAQFAMEYDGKVHVADNHRISVTLKESVYEAKHMADRGCEASDIKEYLERSAYESSIYVAVNSLKYLKIRIGAAGTFEKEEDAGWWLEMVRETFPDTEVYYTPLSCSIASHVGIDSVGIGVCVVSE